MRRFMVHLVTEIDFVDGDQAADVAAQNYQKHLKDTVQNAAQELSLQKSRMSSNGAMKKSGAAGVLFKQIKLAPGTRNQPASVTVTMPANPARR
jgi:hypothetical protein